MRLLWDFWFLMFSFRWVVADFLSHLHFELRVAWQAMPNGASGHHHLETTEILTLLSILTVPCQAAVKTYPLPFTPALNAAIAGSQQAPSMRRMRKWGDVDGAAAACHRAQSWVSLVGIVSCLLLLHFDENQERDGIPKFGGQQPERHPPVRAGKLCFCSHSTSKLGAQL
ncbi:hypothetical protein B0T20DRAFT_113940 [Sordaria brevicollis]|uniref:Secreted protein n=1 Tax=Sordaria brevicollis TaxID=83679 RepID=A0AAE0UF05_SORBR|nr:hypothetical protein B0T20DRAFT_113940 [Sordaria brevicollis]